MFINWNYAPWDDSVVPESDRQDEHLEKSAEQEQKDSERGNFKDMLGKIDEYINSLTNKSENSKEQTEDKLQEANA